MSAEPEVDVWGRAAQWVPIILFHAGLYRQDNETGWAILEPGNPLFDAMPIDQLAALLMVIDALCDYGDVTADDIESLMKTWGEQITGGRDRD